MTPSGRGPGEKADQAISLRFVPETQDCAQAKIDLHTMVAIMHLT
jgi:hypothetical protein